MSSLVQQALGVAAGLFAPSESKGRDSLPVNAMSEGVRPVLSSATACIFPHLFDLIWNELAQTSERMWSLHFVGCVCTGNRVVHDVQKRSGVTVNDLVALPDYVRNVMKGLIREASA
jgi:hypothetical protein